MAQELKQREVKQKFDCLQEESLLSQKFRKNHNLIVIKIDNRNGETIFYCYTREEIKNILDESPQNPPFRIQSEILEEKRKYRENPLYWYYKLPVSGHFVDHTLADLYNQRVNTMVLVSEDRKVTLFKSMGVSAVHDLEVESFKVEPIARCELYDTESCQEANYFEPEKEGESEVEQEDEKQKEEGDIEMKAVMEQVKINAEKMRQKMSEQKKRQLEEKKTYWPNGQLKTHEFYKNDKPEGERKVYYENGKLAIQEFYENGNLHGKRFEMYDNGSARMLENYKNGLREGYKIIWPIFYNSRGEKNPLTKGFYIHGLPEGIWTEWHENGKKWIVRNYKNGKLEGEYQEWSENGALYKHEMYMNNVLIQIIL